VEQPTNEQLNNPVTGTNETVVYEATGRYRSSFNEKAQVKLPSAFLGLGANYKIINSLEADKHCLFLLPVKKYKEYTNEAKNLMDLETDIAKKYEFKKRLDTLNRNAQAITLDGQNRFVIPQNKRGLLTGLEEVILDGLESYVEIWNEADELAYYGGAEAVHTETTVGEFFKEKGLWL
jgi:DNA-binding transcriptional regulator/RsmH inhibitor MraZ